MKSLNIYTFLTGLLCFFVGLITCACEKESPWELTETEDVCSMMDDPLFINLCRNYHDYNHDGLFSMQEAASITELNCMESSLTSLKGIEYFTALLKLNWSLSHATRPTETTSSTVSGLSMPRERTSLPASAPLTR